MAVEAILANHGATSSGVVPVGAIIMWSGSKDAIPDGWALCDGTIGTPDLRGRFVVGAGGAYAVGNTGGEETHRLTVNEMPSHSHAVNSLQASSAGNHSHTYTSVANSGATPNGSGNSFCRISGSSSTGSSGAHTHGISGTLGGTGSDQAHENRPPYYALCYIMRVS